MTFKTKFQKLETGRDTERLRTSLYFMFFSTCRVKKLKSTPIYVKPQFTSDSGSCRVSVMVGLRHDPGKTIDSITVQFQLPSCVVSSDLIANHGTVDILANKVTHLCYFSNRCKARIVWLPCLVTFDFLNKCFFFSFFIYIFSRFSI